MAEPALELQDIRCTFRSREGAEPYTAVDRTTLRVVAGGVFALAVTAAIGKLFGIAGV